jgi:minimal PKS chain-length factor (CLF/KS beta)
VITGIGVVAPTGVGTEPWWDATLRGVSGIRPITRFDASRYPIRHAGQIEDFDPGQFIERRLLVQTDRWTWLGLAATEMALGDARFAPSEHDPYSMSVITASSSGGNEFSQGEIERLWSRGPRHVGAYMSIAWFYAATSGQISIRHGVKGPSSAVAAEGAGGLVALGQARRAVRRGIDTVITGGVEASVGNPMALTCQLSNPAVKQHGAATSYRPFDAAAGGYLPGEGGAILLVESLAQAQAREGAHVYAEILGCGATSDAADPCHPAREPQQYARAIEIALRDASVAPDEIDAVVADGAGTRDGDALEAQAIQVALGSHSARVPVTVPKSTVGRLYAGGAAIDVAAAALAMRDQVLPPTINVSDPVPDWIDLVRQARPAPVQTVLVLARGHGGFNSAVVLRGPH